MDVATRGLATMNMFLHNNDQAVIKQGNTLAKPFFTKKDGSLKTFDFAVANPPFSSKAWSTGFDAYHDEYKRFEGIGVPPAKNGDYAFLLHLIKSLNSIGKGAIILPHGVLFRGNTEAKIRKNLIKRGYIKGIISLPANLFFGTGIPACIIVIDKEDAASRKDIFMIDASKGYIKDGNKNRFREQDIHKIVNVFNNQSEIPKYSRMVPTSEIADPKNDYNLNIPRYIDSQEEEDLQDIEAHLLGGIPAKDVEDLEAFWTVCPTLKDTLFAPNERSGYYTLKVDKANIKSAILENPDFIDYSKKLYDAFHGWKKEAKPLLDNLNSASKPKEVIVDISEKLLSAFENNPLLDKYDVYQRLMDYWSETMQDDVYLIASNGWKIEIDIIKNKKGKETGWKCDLIPKNIVTYKYFQKEKEEIEKLIEKSENFVQQMETLDEENSGEDDLFSEVRNDSNKISRTEIKKRIREIRGNSEFADELKILQEYSNLAEHEAEIKSKIKDAEANLDTKLRIKYNALPGDEVKTLVVESKWLKTLFDFVTSEMERVAHKLTRRIKELAERYEAPLPKLTQNVEELSKNVDNHLKNMGFKW